ncbi:hypothetical protein T484DRAFT_1811762 [Baffinella frigidus]|nr:hypothetical protein T484DRAFT_1811762 [Cryptophyta sp. CCMP2293]
MLLRALLGAVIVATATSFALNAPHVALAPRLATPPRTLPRQACSTRRSGLLMTTGKNLERGKEMAVKLNKEGTEQRLNMLEAQPLHGLEVAVQTEPLPSPHTQLVHDLGLAVFTTALIAGDDVILHVIHKAGLLDKIKVIFIDTMHLFPETYDFLDRVEKHYGFKVRGNNPMFLPTSSDFPLG